MNAWRKLLALTPRNRLVLCQAAALLPMAWMALRLRPLPALTAAVRRRALRAQGRPDQRPLSPDDADAWARLVTVADRHGPLPPSCLRKSLVLAWLLAARGIDATVKLGVTTERGALAAHAWLEVARPSPRRFFNEPGFELLVPAAPS